LLAEQEEDEDTFTLDRSRLSPRLEWQATERINGYAFYRIEYDLLSGVDAPVRHALEQRMVRPGHVNVIRGRPGAARDAGIDSVRGYGRRRIGPLVDDKPIGGRTVVEGYFELRHPITEKVGAAVFIDGGQLSRRSFDFPFGRLRYGAGLGLSYRSPVGPLRVQLGVPFQPPD